MDNEKQEEDFFAQGFDENADPEDDSYEDCYNQ